MSTRCAQIPKAHTFVAVLTVTVVTVECAKVTWTGCGWVGIINCFTIKGRCLSPRFSSHFSSFLSCFIFVSSSAHTKLDLSVCVSLVDRSIDQLLSCTFFVRLETSDTTLIIKRWRSFRFFFRFRLEKQRAICLTRISFDKSFSIVKWSTWLSTSDSTNSGLLFYLYSGIHVLTTKKNMRFQFHTSAVILMNCHSRSQRRMAFWSSPHSHFQEEQAQEWTF